MQKIRTTIQLLIIILTITITFKYTKIGTYLVLFIIFFGVFYCGWICPFGAIRDFINKISKKLKIKRYRVPDKIQKYLVYTRYFLYSLVFVKLISMSGWNPRVLLVIY